MRKSTDRQNPTLPGGVYGYYKTAGRGVFYYFDGARVRFILFIADGGRYGMGDLTEVSYKKVRIAPEDYKYHRGIFTAQIDPRRITAVNANALTSDRHPFVNASEVRLNARGGTLPAPLVATRKYFVVSATTNTFRLSETSGGAAIALTTAGFGIVTAWLAVTGFDDPEQGLPFFCPQVETTFSGIAYIEGLLPAQYNTDAEPDWQDFRIGGLGRRLMDYDGSGNETGVVTTDVDLLTNPALCDADCLIVDYRKPLSRFDWASWFDLRNRAIVKLLQTPDFTAGGSGLTGEYFSYSSAGNPVFVNPVFSRRDATIDFEFGGEIPAPELPSAYYSILWRDYIKAKYSELYTFRANHDDGVRLWVNGVLLINQGGLGDHTATFQMTANSAYAIRVEFWNETAPGYCRLKWSSPSQTEEIVPVQALYEPEIAVNRYQYSGAAATPIEAADYHEQIMLRCPGWDWTDANGKIVYLPPDRPVAYEFLFDAEDADAVSTFLDKSFQKSRRPRRDRKNFVLYSLRNQNLSFYPEEFVEENRPRLRELAGGVPNNDAPKDLLVMTRSLAQRIADLDMVVNTDPANDLSLEAGKAAGVVTKKKLVRVRNWVEGDNRIEDAYCLVISVERNGNRLRFELVPVAYPFYTDIPASG